MSTPTDKKLPQDGWLALHPDGTICTDWTYGSSSSAGVFPLMRVQEKEPPLRAECEEGGETLEWRRISLMAQNAAVTAGGRGAVRFQEDDDA